MFLYEIFDCLYYVCVHVFRRLTAKLASDIYYHAVNQITPCENVASKLDHKRIGGACERRGKKTDVFPRTKESVYVFSWRC